MNYLERTDFIFNTEVSQKIVFSAGGESILEEATKIMNKFEEMLSFYRATSDISKVNVNAGECFTKVSNDTFNILQQAKAISDATSGIFDITIAPLVKAWAINSDTPNVLSQKEVLSALKLVNYNDVLLNDLNTSVMLSKKKQMIDLGGIAKGYIADRIIDFYKSKGVTKAMINLGGNAKVLGTNKDNLDWKIAIREPLKGGNDHPCYLTLQDTSIVTSGGYERAFIYDNELYHHILNPVTGYPAKTDLESISIIHENSMLCDALSTPLFIMGSQNAMKFLQLNNISGVMITKNKEIILSQNLIKNFHLLKNYKTLCF